MDAPPDVGEPQPVRTRTSEDAGAPDMPELWWAAREGELAALSPGDMVLLAS
ncbi:hypothetical protein FRC08_004310 [Ceratobasidium sp. 394]|nr:hypothetical protein FRC08_004310 [Ceratobasidium sp. 394]